MQWFSNVVPRPAALELPCACEKCSSLGFTLDLLIRNLGGDPDICILTTLYVIMMHGKV